MAAGRLAQVGRRVAQPYLSPIEEAFSKLKTVLRRAAARTREALEQAIAIALDQITAQDAQGYFRHCGSISKLQRFTKYARCCIDRGGVGAASLRLRLHQKRTSASGCGISRLDVQRQSRHAVTASKGEFASQQLAAGPAYPLTFP